MNYLVEVNIVFCIFYGAYSLFFSRLTFHAANRWFLLLLLPLSFAIPAVEISFQAEYLGDFSMTTFNEIIEFEEVQNRWVAEKETPIPWLSLLWGGYWMGVVVFVQRLVFSAFNIFSLKRNAIQEHNNGFVWITANIPAVFSFFKWIFVPQHQTYAKDSPVIEHEKHHIKQGHSFDLIVTELLLAFLWFNPFAYFFRKSIRTIHECQVDAMVLSGNIKKSEYLQLIYNNLKLRSNHSQLQHFFNGITVKKRIDMITKKKSSNIHTLRYFILLPLVGLLLLASTTPIQRIGGIVPSEHMLVAGEANTEFVFPIPKGVDYKITHVFGRKFKHPITKKHMMHRGIDIAAKSGTDVLSIADGVIEKVELGKKYGRYIVVNHGNGLGSLYAHLQGFEVKKGQQVKMGETIGKLGNTGLSTGPHLHLEVKKNKKHVDPFDYIEE